MNPRGRARSGLLTRSARWRDRSISPPATPDPAATLIVAHRGDSAAQAEHTRAAYRAALDTGADGLECDVRLTRDGHLVCVHDRKVNRTSNGHGVVSELDLAGLRQLDFSSWHEPDEWPQSADEWVTDGPYLDGVAPDRDADGGVLTLSSLLALVADAGRPVHLLIETKHPTRYAGLVEKELVRVLRRYGPARPADGNAAVTIIVMSFATIALRRVHLLAPELPTVLLVERLLPGVRGDRLGNNPIVGPSLALLRYDPDLVARSHAHGHQVYVWTVDDEADVEFALRLGVDAVITNDPGQALRVRDRLAAAHS